MDDANKSQSRFTLGRQSSKAPERHHSGDDDIGSEALDSSVRLMYLANEGDLDGIKELLDSGSDVNFRDIDGRTALHVAACQGLTDVVEMLIQRGAEVDPKDRWGSTPLADAMYYKNHVVVKLLEKHGAKPPMAPMHVQNVREVPEYEINPSELDFRSSVRITKGTFRDAFWRGTHVAVKTLGVEVLTDDDKVKAFRDELALLQKIRHPNVVQFLGAVTQSTPMMIVRVSATGRYVAPEVYKNDEYDTKVYVFSFALILQEMIEGCPPFRAMPEKEVPKAYVASEHPQFKASSKVYAHGLKELIEECWHKEPHRRLTFGQIIERLENISRHLASEKRWEDCTSGCFPKLRALFQQNRTNTGSRSSRLMTR